MSNDDDKASARNQGNDLRATGVRAIVLLAAALLATACATGAGLGGEEVDICLLWRNTMDPDTYVADMEARVIVASSSISSEKQTALRKCLQDSESDFIGKVDARCAAEGTLQESEMNELVTEEWTFPCIDEVLGE
jgi:hypothetical protein